MMVSLRGAALAALMCFAVAGGTATAIELVETPTLSRTHPDGLPPIAERVPAEPLIVDVKARGREIGRHGGDLNTLIGRSKDRRLINVWGYSRLMVYNEKLELVPDILKSVQVDEGRIFTFGLRNGHRWSDGHPFTAEDFRYWWEDISNNEMLSPSGPDQFMLVDGQPPQFEVIDPQTVRFTWHAANPQFLTDLAKSRPPFIYRPAHYLKQFHENYGDVAFIEAKMEETKTRNWASLHNQKDEMYSARNVDEPSLQPWVVSPGASKQRATMVRNPYYHRVDTSGQQLPYIDRIIMTVADKKLIAAKTQAGESQLQARNMSFSDVTVLKEGEAKAGYKTLLWPIAKGAHIALFPNLNVKDPVWREVLRDVRFRRALSLASDRTLVNQSLYFGLATEGNNTVLPNSPLFREDLGTKWAVYDVEEANGLLDDMGLTERGSDGIRKLPDGRPLEIIVESAGERQAEIDALELLKEGWRDAGINLFVKPSQRDNLRNRAYSGDLVMAVWEGHENGLPTASTNPVGYVPASVDMFTWYAWGDHYETQGGSGEAVDYPPAEQLMALYKEWLKTTSNERRAEIWGEILDIHADEVFSIGIVSGVQQPVAVSNNLRNVPENAFYGWDPGAQYGIFRMDEFWLAQ
ncbi:MAG: ABC transporter substrate-binding protein [Pseudomonadota bacterium]